MPRPTKWLRVTSERYNIMLMKELIWATLSISVIFIEFTGWSRNIKHRGSLVKLQLGGGFFYLFILLYYLKSILI